MGKENDLGIGAPIAEVGHHNMTGRGEGISPIVLKPIDDHPQAKIIGGTLLRGERGRAEADGE